MGRRLALLIGNNEYSADPGFVRLSKAENDVNGLAEVLIDPRLGGFEIPKDLLLINRSAVEIASSIEEFYGGAKSDDLLLLYFAGHGILDSQGNLCLAGRDTRRRLLMTTSISARFISEALNNSFCRSQIVILDCCYSGAFVRGVRSGIGSSVGTKTIFDNTQVRRARVIMTATDATQFAFEDDAIIGNVHESGHSIFSRYLIDGLKTGVADRDGDGEITHDELFDYVHDRVIELTADQTPQKWEYGYEGRLIVGFNPQMTAASSVLIKKDTTNITSAPLFLKQEAILEYSPSSSSPIDSNLVRDDEIDFAMKLVKEYLYSKLGRRSDLSSIIGIVQPLFPNDQTKSQMLVNRLIGDGYLEETRIRGMYQLSETARARINSRRLQ
jgi:hypothetical protein